MFGIGFGEIILILLAVFLIAPREIPAVLKKVGTFFRELDKLKREIFSMKGEMEEIINEAGKTVKDTSDSISPVSISPDMLSGDSMLRDDRLPMKDKNPLKKTGDAGVINKKKGKKADGKKPLKRKPEGKQI